MNGTIAPAGAMSSILGPLFDTLLPFGLLVADDGNVLCAGRTLTKLCGGARPTFADIFDVRAPRTLRGTGDLARLCNRRLTLRLRDGPGGRRIKMRGQAVALPGPVYLVDTSLGADMPDLVAALDLGDEDFAMVDRSVDLLHVLRSRQVLVDDSRKLAAQLSDAEEAVDLLTRTDPLTGLPNRRAFHGHVERLLARSADQRRGLTVLHVDLDRFKRVNDAHGHAAGDAVLVRVAAILRRHLQGDGMAARTDGDEFSLVLDRGQSAGCARALAQRLVDDISEPLPHDDTVLQVRASVGVAHVAPDEVKTLDRILLEADLALFEVKDGTRGRVRLFDRDLAATCTLAQDLARDIAPAIAQGEFVPFFQPQIDVRTNTVIGAEVLVRWAHPRHGVLSPAQFLYVADRARLTRAIDDDVRAATLAIFADWRARGVAPHHVAFNLTADRLTDERFADRVVDEVAACGLSPADICFELLETILVDGRDKKIVDGARRLSDAGFRLSLDDFGTGHASVASLIAVPVSTVKIDRTFVEGVHDNARLRAMTAAIAGLAEQLGLDVLAEGVERPEDLEALGRLGCHQVQGHIFATAMDAAAFEDWFVARDGDLRARGSS